jgi:diguanylate cyclase (GGDEF)-like protein/PAS domain S-box-containing protein
MSFNAYYYGTHDYMFCGFYGFNPAMKKLSGYILAWELLLIPIVAAFGFGANLIYTSMVLSNGNAHFKDIRDDDFPILKEAESNLDRYEAILVAFNTAAATGEVDYMDIASTKANEMRASFDTLAKLDVDRKHEIEQLKSRFNTYFSSAIDISRQIATQSSTPNFQQISEMRGKRDLYVSSSLAYRDAAEKGFHEIIDEAIGNSERAKVWGLIIGLLMLMVIMTLTWLVVLDLAKRKRLAIKLRASEEASRIAAIAFETHDAIVITDPEANIIKANRAFLEMSGYSEHEVLGKNPGFMNSGRHERIYFTEIWHNLLQSGTWSGELWNRRKNGEIYPSSMTITAAKDESQKTTHYVAIFSDITTRKKIEEEIHNLAFYDALTKLPNRRLFIDRFQAALASSARRNDYGALLFIDLDRFKLLNDTLGHEYGDLLLIEVGVRIKSCIRETDTAARFGGDEFVVLFESISDDRNDALRKVSLFAEKIRESLSQPYTVKAYEHDSSPSIGICLHHGNDDTLETLLERADFAMYQAKKSGRNTVRIFEPPNQ